MPEGSNSWRCNSWRDTLLTKGLVATDVGARREAGPVAGLTRSPCGRSAASSQAASSNTWTKRDQFSQHPGKYEYTGSRAQGVQAQRAMLPDDELEALVAAAGEEAAKARRADADAAWTPDADHHQTEDDRPWTKHGGAGLDPLLLTDPDAGEAPVRLLDARFLIALARTNGSRLCRRQDLPAEAFLSVDELWRMRQGYGGCLRVMCVSYPWLQPDHPDPQGGTLRLLSRVLASFVTRTHDEGTYGVFLDFCSLPQKNAEGVRSPSELTLFQRGLGRLDQLYSHPKTFILKATVLPEGYPEGFTFPPGASPNQAAYYERGWCFCESSMGNLVKESCMALDLGNLAAWTGTGTAGSLVGSLTHACRLGRPPPLHPDDFAAALETKSFTSKKADLKMVAALYRRAFETRVAEAEQLVYSGLGWGDDEVKVLCRALVAAASCRLLLLDGNAVGNEGVLALVTCLRSGAAPRLAKIVLTTNAAWSAATVQDLRGAREGLTVVATVQPRSS